MLACPKSRKYPWNVYLLQQQQQQQEQAFEHVRASCQPKIGSPAHCHLCTLRAAKKNGTGVDIAAAAAGAVAALAAIAGILAHVVMDIFDAASPEHQVTCWCFRSFFPGLTTLMTLGALALVLATDRQSTWCNPFGMQQGHRHMPCSSIPMPSVNMHARRQVHGHCCLEDGYGVFCLVTPETAQHP